MTDPSRPPPPPPPPPKHMSADGCVTVLFVLFGVIFLLPGLCSLIFMAQMLPGGFLGGFWVLWVFGLGISAFGIAVMVYAIRHR